MSNQSQRRCCHCAQDKQSQEPTRRVQPALEARKEGPWTVVPRHVAGEIAISYALRIGRELVCARGRKVLRVRSAPDARLEVAAEVAQDDPAVSERPVT